MLLSLVKWAGGKLLLPAILFAAAYFAGRHAGTLAERVIWQARQAQAQVDALKAKAAIEHEQAVVSEESSHEIKIDMADAIARANAFVARLRAQADSRPSDLSEPAGSPVGTDGTATVPIMADDVTVCTENTVKAQGWQDWWQAVAAASERAR